MIDFSLEEKYGGVVAGIDEAGRGPLCGPVYAACVVLDRKNFPDGINDSKKLTEKKREKLFEEMMELSQNNHLWWGVGIVDNNEIDKINILQATKKAMCLAYENLVEKCKYPVEMVLVDGNFTPPIDCKAVAVVGGDAKSFSIAAASIIAKVLRDRELLAMDEKFPQYHWKQNKGYGTLSHRESIAKYGLTPYHRKSFTLKKQLELFE